MLDLVEKNERNGSNLIATWIYLDSPEERSEYPQAGKQSHLPEFQAIYWRCVAVFYTLSTQHNPDCRHILFSNKGWNELPVVDQCPMKQFLQEKNVELVTIPLTWQTPPGYFGKWRNQFYIFDILQFIEKTYTRNDACIVLDSDCLIRQSLAPLFGDIRKHGLMVLPMPYDTAHPINGISRTDMCQLFSELDGQMPAAIPLYYGGEIFAATAQVVADINAMAPAIWQNMLERHRNGQAKFNEEAHFLSYCYHRIGRFGLLDGYIKRIWTAPHYNNVSDADAQLPVWHLPSEKTGGIALLFKKMHQLAHLHQQLGDYVGIPQRKYYLNWKHFLKYSWLYRFFKK
jgi:hypothetical protein